MPNLYHVVLPRLRRKSLFERLEARILMAAKELIWIEGENPASTTFNRSGYYETGSINKGLLSPNPTADPNSTTGGMLGEFVVSPATNIDVRAVYNFNVATAGNYYMWMRVVDPKSTSSTAITYSTYGYRLDAPSGAFTDINLLDVASKRSLTSTPDFRFIEWKYVALKNLSAGAHTLEIRLTGAAGSSSVHGGIDVIAFANFNFGPTGPLKPDLNPAPAGADDWFTYAPGIDAFSPASVIDRSSLIEAPAGQHGRVLNVGDAYQFTDGTPTKFWGISAIPDFTAPELQAKTYRKYGINLVRVHTVEDYLGELEGPANARTLNAAKADQFDKWFKAMRDQGIYVQMSLFYQHVIKSDEGIDPNLYNELGSKGSGKNSYLPGGTTFIREYQDSQWNYARTFMQHVNPYTGLSYATDPAVAAVETRNEDSIFWGYPMNVVPVIPAAGASDPWKYHRARLTGSFGAWVKAKYGTEAALTAAWSSSRDATDDWTAGSFRVASGWMFGAAGPIPGSWLYSQSIQRAKTSSSG
ncbi:MAG: hypothetical protein QM770_03535 [Tepidisphaeraceae bacterium]